MNVYNNDMKTICVDFINLTLTQKIIQKTTKLEKKPKFANQIYLSLLVKF